MKLYRYRALDSEGDLVDEERMAGNRQALEEHLQEEGKTLVSVNDQTNFSTSTIQHNRLLSRFFQNLALFLSSGMELIPALDQIRNRVSDEQLRSVVTFIISNLQSGQSLEQSFAQCEPFIPLTASRICGVAEQTGRLSDTFEELSDFYESRYEFLNELYSAMIYPVLVIGVSIFVLGFVTVFVLPQLSSIFVQQDIELPMLTRWMLWISDWFQGYSLMYLLGGGCLMGLGIYLFGRSRWGDSAREWLLFQSKFFRKTRARIFCLSMSMAVSVDMDITRALDLGADVVNHRYLTGQLHTVREKVKSGVSLTDALRESDLEGIPYDTLSMGESTGRLGEVFEFTAELLQQEIEDTLQRWIQYVEPIVLLFLAIVVGLVVSSVMIPLFQAPGTLG